ncbi:polyprenol monophosphomannose synthase [Gryllotalpicola protaetiae]|uniref:Polyprenol monophosphomannose synthase n=1 Tax=Gryllotalpicola protaetiae TaxID=2419771 RepID=A0A387BW57_9MICO|nr:polyprenol monophosphomannose synthase [Gryllotalpicola protaetiae]AYG05346.1 polyprenol monophosphomannose synthase [Gryllotalpicola protaetiae]
MIPTYNERDNLEWIVGRVRAAQPDAHVLVVDDSSPDGTGELADALAAADPHVHVLHRPGKQGLGRAYIEAMRWGVAHGYDVLVELDADGSHQPEQLGRLLEKTDDADVVLGSRWVPGGSVENWPWYRQAISRAGSAYARVVLGLGVRDVTGGYRAFRASALDALDLDTVHSHGYAFQVDMLQRAVRAGLDVVEVPITFVERERGASKMSLGIVAEAMLRVTVWSLTRRRRS